MEGLPGEFSQDDFGHVDVRFLNGNARRVHFFASRLKYSRWVEVSLVPDERVETLVRVLVAHFAAMGGGRAAARRVRKGVNVRRPSRATGVPPAERLAAERPRLRPLKIAPADLALRIPVVVGPTGVVAYDAHPFSMPPEAIGLPGTLYLYRDRVRIVAGRGRGHWRRNARPRS